MCLLVRLFNSLLPSSYNKTRYSESIFMKYYVLIFAKILLHTPVLFKIYHNQQKFPITPTYISLPFAVEHADCLAKQTFRAIFSVHTSTPILIPIHFPFNYFDVAALYEVMHLNSYDMRTFP